MLLKVQQNAFKVSLIVNYTQMSRNYANPVFHASHHLTRREFLPFLILTVQLISLSRK